jgi:dTDP-glucose pyrophosphorylase
VKDIDKLVIRKDQTLIEALECIDKGAEGIALVVSEHRKLIGTITDGDLRRATLAGRDMANEKVEVLLRSHNPPVTAPVGASSMELMQLMKKHSIRHVPVVDAEGRIAELALLKELALEDELPVTAVVMAGGKGTRMRPLTETVPKPMLPVGDRPVMEHVLEQLQSAGISHVSITTHYMPEAIESHFGDGRRFGVEIDYVNEKEPLGTAGALGLLKAPKGPVLVINGDVLTQVNFRSMFQYHADNQADMTVGVRRFELQVPYGVIDMEESRVTRLDEKPTYRFFINAGVYLIEPDVLSHIKVDEHLDATELIDRLIDAKKKVVGFPIHEYWLDIGRPDDYARANKEWTNG